MKDIMKLCYINAREICSTAEAKELLSDKIGEIQYDYTEPLTVSLMDEIDDNDREIRTLLKNGGDIENLLHAVELLGDSSDNYFHRALAAVIGEYLKGR